MKYKIASKGKTMSLRNISTIRIRLIQSNQHHATITIVDKNYMKKELELYKKFNK
jgi:hypothetical protein